MFQDIWTEAEHVDLLSKGLPATLHVFADASGHAFSVAIYLSVTNSEGKDILSLIFGKVRVTPLKQSLSMPKKELVACFIAARLGSTITQHMTRYLLLCLLPSITLTP